MFCWNNSKPHKRGKVIFTIHFPFSFQHLICDIKLVSHRMNVCSVGDEQVRTNHVRSRNGRFSLFGECGKSRNSGSRFSR